MDRQTLISNIKKKRSYLCVGLDTDPAKIPPYLLKEENPVLAFNKAIIEATSPYCVAYKLNTAFYEALGHGGWQTLADTLAYIPQNIFTIADAKRGDIGNTSTMYAKAFFEQMDFDAITVAPYMGHDSVKPFLAFANKWTILLGLTSNQGKHDFQMQALANGQQLYEQVIQTAMEWGTPRQLMLVVGATGPEQLREIRLQAPEYFFLVPGVGAQGGNLAEVSAAGLNGDVGLLVNSSRAIIYANNGESFAEAAGLAAQKLQQEMATYLQENQLI